MTSRSSSWHPEKMTKRTLRKLPLAKINEPKKISGNAVEVLEKDEIPAAGFPIVGIGASAVPTGRRDGSNTSANPFSIRTELIWAIAAAIVTSP
jgi:hypothetical protein